MHIKGEEVAKGLSKAVEELHGGLDDHQGVE